MYGLDSRAVDLGDVGGVHEHERDDPPERRRLRDPAETQRRRAQPEQGDHEDRGDPAKEIRVHDRDCPNREEHRSRQAPKDREAEGEHEDEDLGDAEDLDVQQERIGDPRERRAKLLPVEERVLDLRPAGRVDDREPEADEDDERRDERDEDGAAAAVVRG
jgi:hypothetical protein